MSAPSHRYRLAALVVGLVALFLAPSAEAGADAEWLHSVSQRLASDEYHASPTGGGFQAPNRAQNLRTRFGAQGIAIEPRSLGETSTWRFGWETAALGRPGQMSDAVPAVVQAQASRVTYARPGWSEWYENTPAGLEQGFTIDQRPPGAGPLSLIGNIAGDIAPELHDGEIDLVAGDVRVLHYGKLSVTDARGHEVPASLAVAGRTITIRIDDRDAAYPLTIDPLMTSPAWVAQANQALAYFGISVSTAGDVNGDGFSDVIVGASQYDNGQDQEGRAFVFLGSASGLATSAAWTAESNQAGAIFGTAVATAGDVNGDGFSDVIVGASNYSNTQPNEGRAFVYMGSATGLGPAPAWTADGGRSSAHLISVSTAGDVNGDGFSDVIVGADLWADGPVYGRAWVYLGSAAGLATSPAWTAAGNGSLDSFGFSVGTVGDVNGDGFSDIIVGAFRYGNFESGRAYVYLGSAGGVSASPIWTGEGNQDGAFFGYSVATAGDVNGDGFSDIVVGAAYYSNGQTREGRAYLYLGSVAGPAASPAWITESDQAHAFYGISVATAGDVNGDGFSDVVVGAYQYDHGETDEGRASVYLGSATGLGNTPAWTAESNQSTAAYGVSVGTAGDVNGDGFSDVIVGAYQYDNGQDDEGRVFVYHGGSDGLAPAPAWFMNGGQAGAGFGWTVATAGDVNGDGYSDVLATAYAYDNGQVDEGKVWLYHGSPSGSSTVPAWSAETNQAGAQLNSATSAGDVNGDGYSDVILGSTQFDNGQSDEGRTWLYLGSAAGLSPVAAWTSEPDQAGAWFGISLGSAGDVNGDGYADVIVGAYAWDNGQSSEGRAWLYLGSAGGLGAPAWAIEGDQDDAFLGASVGTAGDVNADGFSDVLVSLPVYDRGQSNEGVVWVFHGSANGLGASPSRVLEVDQANASFGNRVATAGDVNGDGFTDVIIGASGYTNGQQSEGKAFVYHGGVAGLGALPAWSTESDQTLAQLDRVATAGDVNGDGYSDVVVGAPFYDNGENNEGKIWLYQGSSTGLGPAVWTTEGGQAGAVYGISVGTAGDVNGDGFSDVIASATDFDWNFTNEGGVWVFLGNQGDGLHRIRQQLRTNELRGIDLLGRSDSQTGFRLFGLGRTPAGRGKVRLQIEAKRVGVPFDGTGLVATPLALTGFPTSDGSIATFIQPVSGLLPGTVYRWRVRIASDSPFFPRSPWLWLPGNGATEWDVRMDGSTTGVDGDVPAPAAGLLLGAGAPNPFRTQTRVAYTVPAPGRVRLGVYDVQGRCVREIADAKRAPGQYAATWDGRNAAGAELPSGIYFVRLEVAGQVTAQKVVIER
jgi:hypothetical protein